MIGGSALNQALDAGPYRVSDANRQPVRCARCSVGCWPGEARRVLVGAWEWRPVYLCQDCCPKDSKAC